MPLIRLEEIRKIYTLGDTEVRALDGVSFTVEDAEFIAIMGASGSGKSTLMNILGCLDRPTSGEYFLNGRGVAKLGRGELAEVRNQTLGFVFQSFNLLSRTSAIENVELPLVYAGTPAKERHLRAKAALEEVGLGDRLDHMPNQLSGGQQQRVAIARALVNDPEILLADEPTGNLDSKTSVEVMGVFQKLNDQGITIVMVTHELDIARFCKRNLILRDGRLVRDELVPDRLKAEEEMRKLRDAEAAAKLTSN